MNKYQIESRDQVIVTVGWSLNLIECLCDRLTLPKFFRFKHILHPSYDRKSLKSVDCNRIDIHLFRESLKDHLPAPDIEALAALETDGVPMIRDMIIGDRVVRHLPAEDALAYMTMLQQRLTNLFTLIRPVFVIGGFDSVHAGIACGVAKHLGIPFYVLNFSVIPLGLCTFNQGLIPNAPLPIQYFDELSLRKLAEETLASFEKKSITAPAYLSPTSLSDLLLRAPMHARSLLNSIRLATTGQMCRFTDYSPATKIHSYLRRRHNRVLLKPEKLVSEVPRSPFLFFGLHMQPESSIDVWASFFSDQFNVIENIYRSAPINHLVLVKLHKSDIDNYSTAQLDRIQRLPRVRIVSPFVSAQDFIRRAALVFAIQGTIGLESALLGRPTIVFGENRLTLFPTVRRVMRLDTLPSLVREQLKLKVPERNEILKAYGEHLRHYFPACLNDWEQKISDIAISGFSELFKSVITYHNLQLDMDMTP